MKIVKIIVPLAFVVFLSGYAKELRHLADKGGWAGLAIVFISFGGLVLCYGVALMPITSRVCAKAGGDKVARLLAEYPGPVTLKASRTGWIMMVVGVVSAAVGILAGVTAFLGQQAGNKAVADLAASALEGGVWALLASVLSVRAFLGAL